MLIYLNNLDKMKLILQMNNIQDKMRLILHKMKDILILHNKMSNIQTRLDKMSLIHNMILIWINSNNNKIWNILI